MVIKYEKDVPLSTLSTFRMGGNAKNVVTLESQQDIKEFFTNLKPSEKWFLVGGGSNIVFPDGDIDTSIIRISNNKITKTKETENIVLLSVDSGVVWDDVVKYAVENNLSGIESLSAIPGTAGATPVQNVGAYGVEIADVLESVYIYDIDAESFRNISKEECRFSYRDSIFKHEGKNKYIIVSILIKLSKDEPDVPQYAGVSEYFAEKGITRPTLSEIRDAIITIRWKKLPNPKEIASVGSFFKNAFVTEDHAKSLLAEFPDIKLFPDVSGKVKVPTGWLIEKAGFKGQSFGNISVYKNNALVLVNEGGATRAELTDVVQNIISEVQGKFGIKISPEPEILEF